MYDEIIAWRRHLHANPELGYELPRTSSFAADKLRTFGCDEVAEGIGRSGVVGVLHGRKQSYGRVIGLRADMDALPIQETTLPGTRVATGIPRFQSRDAMPGS